MSRFALILPEVTATRYRRRPRLRLWDEFSDHELADRARTSRTCCGRAAASASAGVQWARIIVRAMLDYRTLPFISSPAPISSRCGPIADAPQKRAPGRDVEFVVYGWSRAPLFASGTSVWTIPDAGVRAHDRLAERRSGPTSIAAMQDFRVYLMNDRGGIYALGYPVITSFGHLINLAELVTLALARCSPCWLAAPRCSTPCLRTLRRAAGRCSREIRSSFYRKLRLAFWAGSVVPWSSSPLPRTSTSPTS